MRTTWPKALLSSVHARSSAGTATLTASPISKDRTARCFPKLPNRSLVGMKLVFMNATTESCRILLVIAAEQRQLAAETRLREEFDDEEVNMTAAVASCRLTRLGPDETLSEYAGRLP